MDWYYSDGRQQFGPVPESALRELETTGVIMSSTLVWHAGMANWAPYDSVRPAAEPVATAVATAVGDVRYCSQCGQPHPAADMLALGSALVCANCKDFYLHQLRQGGVPAAGLNARYVYAGFWIRFLATLIDWVLLWVIQTIVTMPVFLIIGVSSAGNPSPFAALGMFGIASVLQLGISCLYEAGFLVHKGATPGKMALSLRVIRANGESLGWGLAIGRYFAKIVSGITLLIGYIMAGFDDEKRSLHDRICETRVIRTNM